MNYGRIRHWPLPGKAAVYIGIMLALSIAMIAIWSLSPDSLRQSDDGLRLLQVLQAICVFIGPAILGAMLWSEHPWTWLHVNNIPSWKSVGIGIGIIILAQPGVTLFSSLNEQMTLPDFMQSLEIWMQEQEQIAGDVTQRLLPPHGHVGGLLICLCVMALVPAIGEELCFRATIQGLLGERINTSVAVWATAILFSAIHLQFYGFLPRMLLGALLGFALVKTGSLWIPIVMHFTNNAIAILSQWSTPVGTDSQPLIETLGSGNTWWIGCISIVLTCTALYFWLFRRHEG